MCSCCMANSHAASRHSDSCTHINTLELLGMRCAYTPTGAYFLSNPLHSNERKYMIPQLGPSWRFSHPCDHRSFLSTFLYSHLLVCFYLVFFISFPDDVISVPKCSSISVHSLTRQIDSTSSLGLSMSPHQKSQLPHQNHALHHMNIRTAIAAVFE